MVLTVLRDGQKPTFGFVKRSHPVLMDFARQMTWFSVMEVQPNGIPEMVYVWVLKSENKDYERGVDRKRFCRTYRGQPINLESKV